MTDLRQMHEFIIVCGSVAYCCSGQLDGVEIVALPMFSTRQVAVAFMKRHRFGDSWKPSKPLRGDLIATLEELRSSGVSHVQLESDRREAEVVGIERVIEALKALEARERN
jgi:hypothetical protein